MPTFLPVDPLKGGHIGIAITASSAAAVMVTSGNQAPLQAWVQSQDIFLNSTMVNVPALSAAFTSLKTQAAFPTNKVAFSLPEKFAFSRMFTLPTTSFNEVDEAVGWQVEKLFPYAKEDIYTDWRLLSKTVKDMTVVVTAVPRFIISGIKDSAIAAGFFPVAFEPSVTALGRLVPPDAGGAVVVIELDPTGSSATIVLQAVSQITATCFYQANDSVDLKAKAVAKSVSDLIRHWNQTHSQEGKMNVYVTGEAASADFITALSTAMQVNVQVLPVNHLNPSHHAAYAVALSAIKPPESESTINLLPPGIRSYYQAVVIFKLVAELSRMMVIGIVTLTLFAVLGFVAVKVMAAQKIAALPQSEIGASSDLQNINTVTQNAVRLNKLFKTKTTPENLITTIYALIPEQATLTEFTYEPAKRKLHLAGKVTDRETIITLQEKLAATKLFTSTDLPLTLLNNAAGGEFVFDLEVVKS